MTMSEMSHVRTGPVSWTKDALSKALATVAELSERGETADLFGAAALELAAGGLVGVTRCALEVRVREELELFELLKLARIVEHETGRELGYDEEAGVLLEFMRQAPRQAPSRFLSINMGRFLRTPYPYQRELVVISRAVVPLGDLGLGGLRVSRP